MRTTQADIARIANVSQATVSRVLAGDQRVESSIADLVMRTVKEHNYRPDVRARSLRSRNSNLIGLVVKRPATGLAEDPFFSTLVSHILDYFVGTPYHLCLDIVPTLQSQQAIYDEMLRTRRVDGLILVESESSDQRIYKLREDNFPFVLIGNYENPLGLNGEVPSVDNDNVLAGQLATRHLLDGGYERVGILGGPPGITFSEDRIAGYRAAIAQDGRTELVWHSEFGCDAARLSARSILSSPNRPDALVVLDDFMAMGVVLAARDLGVSIPSQLGIVGFNDSTICSLINGGLTSVSLNIAQIVASACGMLIRTLEDGTPPIPRKIIVPSELRVRGSSIRKVPLFA